MNRIYHINILQNDQFIFLGMLCAMTDVDVYDPYCDRDQNQSSTWCGGAETGSEQVA